MKKRPRHPLFLISIGHGYNDIFWLFLPLILPLLKKEFELTYTQSGLLLTFYTFIIAIFSFITGHLGDKYGKEKIISLGFFLTSAGFTLLVGFNSFAFILILLGIAAVGVSTFHSLAPPLLNQRYRYKKGIIFGIFEAAGSAGIVLMMYLFGLVINLIEWRVISFLIALFGIPLAYFFYRTDYSDLPSTVEKSKIKYPPFILTTFFTARTLRTLGMIGVVSFVPLFIVDTLNLSIQTASYFSGLIFAGGVIGSLITGWLSDKNHPLSIIAALLLIVLPAILFITFSLPLLLTVLLLFLVGICHIGFFPPQNIWLSQASQHTIQGKIFGIGMSLDTMVTAIAPAVFGFLADRWGLRVSFRWTLLPLIIAAFLFLTLRLKGLSRNLRLKRIEKV